MAARLESAAQPGFHPDSYGFRPGRSDLDAVGRCRERCWSFDWVIDWDIAKFFDSPWDLIVAAVEVNTDQPSIVLYVKRWLAAPVQRPDGSADHRHRGTPQGSAVSTVLANLFLYYAFDVWMARSFPAVPFERYVDGAVVHCRSERQARMVAAATAQRMEQVGLELHPHKTRIVYCKDGRRSGSHEHTAFDFLGFTFRARGVRSKRGRVFTGFRPASAGPPSRGWVNRCGPGGCTGVPRSPSRTWRGRSIRSCRGG
ncbi:reverse transcriptase domain-containing protein [Streptomonospora arabica]|uniref:Reverse transcriptase domain-containing protein n=1 Tax=Streptomonospora arabica TaxID=412417 RepID=A0ABV9SGY6_9ACTN